MQPVGEFDEDDADIPSHRQRHFLKVFSLLLFGAIEINVRQLTHAIHKVGDFLAKLRSDVFLGNPRVLNNIM